MVENKALYRRWRPQVFADLVGQNHVKQTILNAIKAGQPNHAYLFAGPRGTGKTSMARLLAKAVNCLNNKDGEPCGACINCVALVEGRMMDVIEIDAASHTGIDDMRNLTEKVNFAPSSGKYKVYVIDEVHMLSKSAFNALLKTLEEPPSHVIFVLATTEVHKLLPTVISRCQYFDFHYLSHEEVTEQLKKIAQQEKIEISDDALQIIVNNSEGSLRDALSILEQAISFSDGEIDQNILKDLLGIVDVKLVEDLTQAVLDKNASKAITLINEIYFKGFDINQLGKVWLNYLREILMIKLGNADLVQRSKDQKDIMQSHAQKISVNALINLLQSLVGSMNSYKVASLPQLALELVVAKSCHSDIPLTTATNQLPKSESKNEPIIQIVTPIELTSVSIPIKKNPLTMAKLAGVKDKLIKLIEVASPSVGAVLKTSQMEIKDSKLQIRVPSKFLKDTLDKPNNRILLSQCLVQAGVEGVEVECIVEAVPNTLNEVADVFDIM
ncbi:MAG: DNA polymerase III subunit gamma/tau [Patescibacteria group bacterium]